MKMWEEGGKLPEAEELLDLLLSGRGRDVLDVNGVGRHDEGCGVFVV